MSVRIGLLGGLVVTARENQVKFRSRKVGLLLALLGLHKGKAVSSFTIQQLLWPDSDGDRQNQNVRRAIADLRDAFEEAGESRDLIQTGPGTVTLIESDVESDVEQLTLLLNEDGDGDRDLRAVSALALYRGCLLETFEDDWIFAYRRQFEELYCSAVEGLCERLVKTGSSREAVRIATEATIRAPLREEPYLASIRAYVALGNSSMALQQFEALERMLDDHFGQTPSTEAHLALDGPIQHASVKEKHPPSANSTDFYILRDSDYQVERALENNEGVILIFGPRQVGKTSLLGRMAGTLRRDNSKVVITDFQTFGRSEVERQETLYRALLNSLASQLGLTYEPSWNEWVGANSNLDDQVRKLLDQVPTKVVWAMDEVDRVFGTEYADDFFGLVRSWHNRRALEPTGAFGRLSLVISYATEAHLFMKDLNQSPFNVGVRVRLRDFSHEQVASLANHFGEVARFSKDVFDITCGHPFLTRRALSFLFGGRTVEELRRLAASNDGPFSDHLKHLSNLIRQDQQSVECVRRVLDGKCLDSPQAAQHLWSAGLLKTTSCERPEFRVPAYQDYFASVFLG
ncbi:MAG TPA: AAA-like domain-containing protein [Fimbriimonadaceae bacterium]|nr:AAA-like domain-containing protein [Fimbriimonadaceae bacterium]